MGCCLTTTAAVHQRHPPKSTVTHPPPPPFEEETVKEVLSETPIVPKPQTPEESKTEVPAGVEVQENVSEISEMYSYSESFSAATTTTTTVADNVDDEVTQKVKTKSPPAKKVPRKRPMGSSGECAVRKERGSRNLGRRQMAPSPEKRRQSPARTTTNTPRYRNVGTSNEGRREVVGRRSRSPAVRGEACQRRKESEKGLVKKSGDLLPVTAGESAVEKTDDGGGVSSLPEQGAEVEVEVEASESLENPLVSLECFIFL